MRRILYAKIALLLMMSITGYGQKIIELPFDKTANLQYPVEEKSYYSKAWETQVVTNVSVPVLEVFTPETTNEGMAVVIAPGGGYYALSIESEGREVARWLASKGITAFVLKYRLVPTGEDGVADLTKEWESVEARVKSVQPLAQKDGLNALSYVRKNAKSYGVDPGKIGFMGFSAGGDVTVNVGLNYQEESRPDFIVPVYPWIPGEKAISPPADAPAILVICASDDPLQLAPVSISIYQKWLEAGHSAALVLYSKGGHGFGMRPQDLPSDNWINHFYQWAIGEGFVNTPK